MQKSDHKFASLLWIFIAVLGRLLPHPPNISPIISMGLFSGTQLSRRSAFAVSLGALFISDLLLSQAMGYPVFGSWSFFSYSAYTVIVWLGTKLRTNPSAGRTLGFLISSSLFYWLWTNFGVWTTESLYPQTLAGLGACYIAALPFLQNSLLGDLAWGLALFTSFAAIRRWGRSYGLSIEGA